MSHRELRALRPGIPLSDSEKKFLAQLAWGDRVADIAVRWDVSPKTAAQTAERMRIKLGATTNPHAVAIAFRAGLLR
jgi:DNA-binding CsgD family transcriptional regulator